MNTYTTPKIEKTPGPWKYHLGRGKHPRYHIQTVGGYQIASTPEIDKFPGIKCFQANACLIASAPNMFEALEGIRALCNLASEGHFVEDIKKIASTALAQAKGAA